MQNNNTQLSPTKAATQTIKARKEVKKKTVQLCRLRSSLISNAAILRSVEMTLIGFVQTPLEMQTEAHQHPNGRAGNRSMAER